MISVALNTVAVAVIAGTVFEVADLGDELLNRALFDIGVDIFAISGFVLTILFAAAAAAASGTDALPRWAVSSGLAVAVLQLITTVAIFATSGFLAAGGAFAFIAFFAAGIWILAVAVVMMRGGPGTTAGAG